MCFQLLTEVLSILFPIVERHQTLVLHDGFSLLQKWLITSLELLVLFVDLKFLKSELLGLVEPALLESQDNLSLSFLILTEELHGLDCLCLQLIVVVLVYFTVDSTLSLLGLNILRQTYYHGSE